MTEFKTQPFIGRRIIAGIIDYGIIYGFSILYVIEQLMGETLGNTLVGLKPISIKENQLSTFKGGNIKPTFSQSLKRHLLDPIDMFFFGLVGILTINNSDNNQRLGDMWAKTIVVKTSELKSAE